MVGEATPASLNPQKAGNDENSLCEISDSVIPAKLRNFVGVKGEKLFATEGELFLCFPPLDYDDRINDFADFTQSPRCFREWMARNLLA